MPAREVTLVERQDAVRAAADVLDAAAREWVEARAGSDHSRFLVADFALDAANRQYRRTVSALEKTEKRLGRRADLTKETR